jgi:hypothetical protein
MGDVVVKAREDKKKRNEKLEKDKEKKERMNKMKMGGTEMTPLNKDSNHHSYMDVSAHDHETPYVAFVANIFQVGSVDEKGPMHEHTRDEIPLDTRIPEHEFEEAEDHCLWTEMPDSIVALNLTMAICKPLTSNTWNYLRVSTCFGLVPLLATFVIQFTSISCLWEDNSDLKDNEYFCSQHPLLQLSVVGIFMLTLLGPLGDIATEACIGLSCKKVSEVISVLQYFFPGHIL